MWWGELWKRHIKDWHAHVCFDAASRDPAWALREIEDASTSDGPLSRKARRTASAFSYQVHFQNEQLARCCPG